MREEGGGNFSPNFFLNNSETVKAFSNIFLEIFVPNFVSLICYSLQVLGKTQTEVFPISRFPFNPI